MIVFKVGITFNFQQR